MPRQQRILSRSGIYHVMIRGNEKKSLFPAAEDRQRFLDTLLVKKQAAGFLIYAYCLMNNHVHLLIKAAPAGLASTMKRINASYAYYFNQKYHRVGPLFRDRFKSAPIEDESYLLAVIRYIHNNPVKAGIVEKAEQYQWSSYNSYLNPHLPQAKTVDSGFILAILANNQESAIQKFKNFSMEPDQRKFMDLHEVNLWTIEAGRAYLEKYLAERWSGQNMDHLVNNKDTRREIILDLKTNTRLSVREIAALLGINRGIVQKAKANK